MPKKYMSLESWIAEAMTDQERQDAEGNVRPCSALAVLCVTGNGSGGKEVDAIRLEGKTWDASALAKRFQRKMESYCQDTPGIAQFVVQAFYRQQEPEASHPVRCMDGEMSTGDQWTALEAPTEKGVLALMIRHTEHKDQIIMQMFRATVGGWAQERHQLQSEVNDAYGIVRELMMKSADNSHQYAMQQLAYQRTSEERKQVFGMVPAMVNGLTGREVFPQGVGDSAIIDTIARRIGPDQVEMLVQLGIVPREMQAPILARLAQTHERDREARAELAKIPPAAPTAAAEVTP